MRRLVKLAVLKADARVRSFRTTVKAKSDDDGSFDCSAMRRLFMNLNELFREGSSVARWDVITIYLNWGTVWVSMPLCVSCE